MPKHRDASVQIIQTWLNTVFTNLRHLSFSDGHSHLFRRPGPLLLDIRCPLSADDARDQSSDAPGNQPALPYLCELNLCVAVTHSSASLAGKQGKVPVA